MFSFYRPGWFFTLDDSYDRGQGSVGLTLNIVIKGYDTYNVEGGENYRVRHLMPVPPAAYNERSWKRWLFEQILLVERHEAAEFFQIGDDRPYAPYHHDGNDPYIVFELDTEEGQEARHR
nr:H513 [uncultured bacterium]